VTGPGHPAPVLDWVLVVLLALLSGVIAVFGVFFLPVYAGSTPLPLVIVAVGIGLAVIPRVGYRLTGQLFAAFLPVMVWFAVTVGLFLATNGLYLGVPVAWQGWQFALLVGVGALSAAASVGLLWGDHLRAQIHARALPSPAVTGSDGTTQPGAAAEAVRQRPGDGGYWS
jgi:hypothetical protein